MTPTSFRLTDEPWIPCLTSDGLASFSLRDVLGRAQEIICLAPPKSWQHGPLLRFVLAVCRRAMTVPAGQQQWQVLWDADVLPDMSAYLDKFADRMDLFSPVHPFAQVPGLEVKGAPHPLSRLMPHVATGTSVPLFSPYTDDAPPLLTPAEAACWLLTALAFDGSGIKTAALTDKLGEHNHVTVSPGKVAPTGPAPASMTGLIIPQGITLKDTLLLNLIPQDLLPAVDAPPGTAAGEDLPIWERPPAGQPGRRPPVGPCDLYLYNPRRVLLHPGSDGLVHAATFCGGDAAPAWSVAHAETHAFFDRSAEYEKALGRSPVYTPRLRDRRRTLACELPGLLEPGDGTLPVPVLAHMQRAATHLPPAYPITVVTTTAVFSNKHKSAIVDLISDTTTVTAAILTTHRDTWKTITSTTTAAVDALGRMAYKLSGNADVATAVREIARMHLQPLTDQALAGIITDPGAAASAHARRVRDAAWRQAAPQCDTRVRAHNAALGELRETVGLPPLPAFAPETPASISDYATAIARRMWLITADSRARQMGRRDTPGLPPEVLTHLKGINTSEFGEATRVAVGMVCHGAENSSNDMNIGAALARVPRHRVWADRILNASSLAELRPLLWRTAQEMGRTNVRLDYRTVLADLITFTHDPGAVRTAWATAYNQKGKN